MTKSISQFRQHLGYRDGGEGDLESSDVLNHNGKRTLHHTNRSGTSCSRSVVTPLGPNRLTLPPGQHPPRLSSNTSEDPALRSHSHSRAPPKANLAPQRPGFFDTRIIPLPLNRALSRCLISKPPPRRAKQKPNERPSQAAPRTAAPLSSAPSSSNKANGAGRPSVQYQGPLMHRDSRQRTMGPPPTPQQQVRQSTDAPPPSTRRTDTSLPLNNRSLPPSQRFVPPAPVANGAGRPSVQYQGLVMHHDSRQRITGPPPTPQQQVRQSTDAPPSTCRTDMSLPLNNRSLPPSQQFAPPAPVDSQRFMPSIRRRVKSEAVGWIFAGGDVKRRSAAAFNIERRAVALHFRRRRVKSDAVGWIFVGGDEYHVRRWTASAICALCVGWIWIANREEGWSVVYEYLFLFNAFLVFSTQRCILVLT
ncbi:hypothetical protein B0H14DRAFT_2585695 [Mycena olivaceomarginata]|nr:hypothetical protein B0H14DRAFT_2585695 [Mycena olivaceomarginata]